MATVKATFLLPVRDNDGRDLLPEIRRVRRGLWGRFHAYTIDGQAEGVYQMADGTQASDIHMKISLILDDSRLGEIEEVLLDFKTKTTQETIYLEIVRDVELRLV